MFLSIITATFNRGYCLPNIYESLLTNDKDDFEWILVDDGSSDNTEILANDWILKNEINIKYIKKQNSGKTDSIIEGFKICPKGDFTLILDSDDFLYDNIIKTLKDESLKLSEDQIGIVGLKSDLKGNLIGAKFVSDSSNYINLYFGKNKIYGDKLFIIKTNLYSKAFEKPFAGEKFIPDNIPYIKTNKYGKLKCINTFIYKGDYLEDGMTANVLKMAANNIKGFIYEKQLLQNEKLSNIDKIKNEIKYIFYSFSGNKKAVEILKDSNSKIWSLFLLLPTYILTWKRIKNIRKIRDEIN